MRLTSRSGRAKLWSGDALLDLHDESGARFPWEMNEALARWREVRDWAQDLPPANGSPPGWDPPVPSPRQIFAIGLNYVDHAQESRMEVPTEPMVFTKFQTSLVGGRAVVTLPAGDVDWEVELVAVVGEGGSNIAESRAWERLAGVMVGQDLSERRAQLAGGTPQFSLAKSHAGFAPIGPAVVTIDELSDPDGVELSCELDGEEVQKATTADMIFGVPELVGRLSRVVRLLPGDLIFSGTPPGVGMGRSPQRFLSSGSTLVSSALGVGTITQSFR